MSEVQLNPDVEDSLLKQIFLFTLNVNESTLYSYLPALAGQVSALQNVLSSFGVNSGTRLNRSLLEAALKEKVPNETGLRYLFQSYSKVQNLLKNEKDEGKQSLLRFSESKILESSKLVLLEQQYLLDQQQFDLYMAPDPNAPLRSELRDQFDQLPPGFLDKLVSSCNVNEVQVIFEPIVTEWVIEMGKQCEQGNLLQKQYVPLLKRVSSLVSNAQLIALLTSFLEREISTALTQTAREMETKSIIASFLGMHTTFNHSALYFVPTVIPNYPNCTVADLRTTQACLRTCLAEIHNTMHNNMKKIFQCKEDNGKPKEILLQWISTILDLNEIRATANPNDPLFMEMTMICSTEGFLLNLMAILLTFSKPFLEPNTDKKKLLSPYYCQFSKRLDYSKHQKLCESVFVNLDVDEKVKNGQFGFVSDIFFLTYHCLHVALIPALSTYKSRLSLVAQTKQQIQQLKDQTGWQNNITVQNLTNGLNRLFPVIDGYDVHLASPDLLMTMLQFCTLAMRWMLDIVKDSDPQVACSIFASFPIYFIKDLLDFVDFTARFHTKTLAQVHLPTMFEFCVVFMNRSHIVKSPLVRARLALLLSTFQYLYKQPPPVTASNIQKGWNAPQQNQPFILSEAEKRNFGFVFIQSQTDNNIKEQLVPGLMHCYIDIGDVEGLDVDKDQIDKYTVRKDIASLLNNLWTEGNFVSYVKTLVLSTNPEFQSQKFLSTVLSDSIMLLDDSLHRLTDIKTLQVAMKSPEWNAQPPEIREKREQYYWGQERSSQAFMALANAILDFLLNLSREVVEPFTRSPEMIQKLVSMLLWFLGRLCGPQMSALKVENKEKYGFKPKELLGKIVKIGTCFAESPVLVNTMANDLDYSPELMSKTHSILVRKRILPSYESDKFRVFFEKVNALNQKSEKQIIQDVPMQMEVDETTKENEEESEKRYKQELEELVFDEVEMKTLDGTYNHHYNDNILKSNSAVISKQKTQKISKECSMMATDLPLSRASSVFIRVDTERMDVMKAIITGPRGSPYAFGMYLFDIFFPPTYPHDPPLVNLETTGNGTVRFNPNLYTDGKVCLSLLGTWHGEQHSKWNPLKSTIIQALISIQAFILCDEPYYNEPSYEAQRGTKEGDEASAVYNENIQFNNIRYAMIQNLRQPPKGFEVVVQKHFALQKYHILAQCENWIRLAKDKPKMAKVVGYLQEELAKLR